MTSPYPGTADARPGARRLQLLLAGALLMCLVLLAGLILRAVTEPGETNSYASLAQSFLDGRLDAARCLDEDCARFDGRIFVIFPPVPALLALPFVALFGIGFSGFIALSIAISSASLALWWRILATLGTDRLTALWLLMALGFATPLYYVAIRGDGVWFFAQTTGFLFVTLAIHQVVRGGSLLIAGLCVGLAFLCRQMSLFYLPFLFALALSREEALISFSKAHIVRALKLGLPVAAAVAVYMAYNYARFGAPMETGYQYIAAPDSDPTLINHRLAQSGLFSVDYLLFNLAYFFVQGFHLAFAGDAMTTPAGLDPSGTSLLAASPFVLIAFLTPLRRPVIIGGLCAFAIALPVFFYHSNGFSQYNVQRYVLDWLPILFYMLGLAVTERERPVFALLATYGIALNVVTMAVLALIPPA